jgi:prophage regulatory protein
MLLRVKAVAQCTGLSVSSIYKQIREGLFPRGVKLTSRATGWPDSEVAKINAARIAGLSDSQMRILVTGIMSARGSSNG